MVKKDETGFTLFEVMFVVLLLGVVMGAYFSAMFQTQKAFENSVTFTGVMTQGRLLMQELETDMRECRVDPSSITHTPTDHHSIMSVRVPVGLDADRNGYDDLEFVRLGDASKPEYDIDDNDVVWGISMGTRSRYSPGSYTYSFVPDPNLQISEIVKGKDYNNDGDMVDTFDVGNIVKTVSYYNHDTAVTDTFNVTLCSDVIQLSTNYSSDINNDGGISYTCNDPGTGITVPRIGDPMFLVRDPWPDKGVPAVENTISGTEIEISVWFIYLDADWNPHLYSINKLFSKRIQ